MVRSVLRRYLKIAPVRPEFSSEITQASNRQAIHATCVHQSNARTEEKKAAYNLYVQLIRSTDLKRRSISEFGGGCGALPAEEQRKLLESIAPLQAPLHRLVTLDPDATALHDDNFTALWQVAQSEPAETVVESYKRFVKGLDSRDPVLSALDFGASGAMDESRQIEVVREELRAQRIFISDLPALESVLQLPGFEAKVRAATGR